MFCCVLRGCFFQRSGLELKSPVLASFGEFGNCIHCLAKPFSDPGGRDAAALGNQLFGLVLWFGNPLPRKLVPLWRLVLRSLHFSLSDFTNDDLAGLV